MGQWLSRPGTEFRNCRRRPTRSRNVTHVWSYAAPDPPYCRIGAGAAVVAVVSRGSDGLALEPPAGRVRPGLLTTCQPVGSLPWRGSKEARSQLGPEIRHARRGHTGTG